MYRSAILLIVAIIASGVSIEPSSASLKFNYNLFCTRPLSSIANRPICGTQLKPRCMAPFKCFNNKNGEVYNFCARFMCL